MNIGILGAGSLGLHLAGQLSMAGKDPIVVCRSREQAQQLNKEGLTYRQLEGRSVQLNIRATSVVDIPQTIDWLLLTVKQPQLEEALAYASHLKAPFSFICFQNGIGHETLISNQFPTTPVYFAVTTEGAYRDAQDSVRHTGKGITWIGKWRAPISEDPSFQFVKNLFSNTSLHVVGEDQIEQRVWKKLIINSCINPLTALLGVKNGLLLESPYAGQAMGMLFEEARLIAELEGIKIDPSFLQEIVTVCRNTYENKSSMLQDIEAGRKTEIEFITGAIEKTASKHEKTVYYHALLKQLVLAKQEM
ncbi:ketopantoate reductase family protein [Ammoniphilus sp. YIM 78166]|uniref:ketopantoate reductase family protein n=1 Tax=Ammoniphilus sp. YIM 78166 TaxID=1644106 RepID=UPI00106F39D8|nr:2-dehydropantoate 2-reductase [Ammoniphilus sp. YIM 78166]